MTTNMKNILIIITKVKKWKENDDEKRAVGE